MDGPGRAWRANGYLQAGCWQVVVSWQRCPLSSCLPSMPPYQLGATHTRTWDSSGSAT